MTDKSLTEGGRKPRSLTTRLVFAALVLGSMSGLSVATDDPYLQMLDQEVTKVEASPTDKGRDSAVQSGGTTPVQRSDSGVSRETFEADLRNHNLGTYSFYRKLPERTREEVYLDYANGASIDVVRDKIIERYLHP